MLLFEAIRNLRYLLEHLKVGHALIHFHEVLFRDFDPRVQQCLLIEQVDEVIVQLRNSLAEMYHVVAIDCLLILGKLEHFVNYLAHLLWFLVLEDQVAHEEVFEAHAVDLWPLLALVAECARGQRGLARLVQQHLALDGYLGRKDAE